MSPRPKRDREISKAEELSSDLGDIDAREGQLIDLLMIGQGNECFFRWTETEGDDVLMAGLVRWIVGKENLSVPSEILSVVIHSIEHVHFVHSSSDEHPARERNDAFDLCFGQLIPRSVDVQTAFHQAETFVRGVLTGHGSERRGQSGGEKSQSSTDLGSLLESSLIS